MTKKYLGLDLGTNSLGIAKSDILGFVHGVENLRFDRNQYVVARKRVHQIVKETGITNIVIGCPLHLNGEKSEMSDVVERFVQDLKNEDPMLSIELFDERLSSVEANNNISQMGYNHDKRKANVDKIAACIILDTFIRKKEANNG